MADIKPYQPSELPSRLVGTPGLDRSAGQAEQHLAAGAAQLSHELGQMNVQNAQWLGGLIGSTLATVGNEIGNHIQAERQQDRMLAKSDLSEAATAYGEERANDFTDAQETYRTHSWDAHPNLEQHFKDRLDEFKTTLSNDARFAKQPDLLKATLTRAETRNAQLLNRIKTWDKGVRTADATSYLTNQGDKYSMELAGQSGDVYTRETNYQNRVQEYRESIKDKSGLIGSDNAAKLGSTGLSKMAYARLANAISIRSKGPEEALMDLAHARDLIDKSGSEPLTEQQRTALEGMWHQASLAEQTKLEQNDQTNQVANKNQAELLKRQAEFAGPADLAKIQLDAAALQAKVDERTEKIQKNPLLDEGAKNVLLRGQVSATHNITSVLEAAGRRHAHLESETNKATQAATTEANRAAQAQAAVASAKIGSNQIAQANLRTDITEAKRVESEAETNAKLLAASQLNDMRDQLRLGFAGTPEDLLAKKGDLMKLAAKISAFVYEKRDVEKTILPDHALSVSQEMENHMKTLALLEQDHGLLGSGFGAQTKQLSAEAPKTKNTFDLGAAFQQHVMHNAPEYERARQQQAAVLKQVGDLASRMKLEKDYAALTVDSRFTPEQRLKWGQEVAVIQAQKNLSPKQFEWALQKLHSDIAGQPKSAQLRAQLEKLEAERQQLSSEQLVVKEAKAQKLASKAPTDKLLVPPPTAPAAQMEDMPDYVLQAAIQQARKKGLIK
jgi:hypothetical protein